MIVLSKYVATCPSGGPTDILNGGNMEGSHRGSHGSSGVSLDCRDGPAKMRVSIVDSTA